MTPLWKQSLRRSEATVAILKWNDLADRKYLQPGQRLTLYVDVTSQSS